MPAFKPGDYVTATEGWALGRLGYVLDQHGDRVHYRDVVTGGSYYMNAYNLRHAELLDTVVNPIPETIAATISDNVIVYNNENYFGLYRPKKRNVAK